MHGGGVNNTLFFEGREFFYEKIIFVTGNNNYYTMYIYFQNSYSMQDINQVY